MNKKQLVTRLQVLFDVQLSNVLNRLEWFEDSAMDSHSLMGWCKRGLMYVEGHMDSTLRTSTLMVGLRYVRGYRVWLSVPLLGMRTHTDRKGYEERTLVLGKWAHTWVSDPWRMLGLDWVELVQEYPDLDEGEIMECLSEEANQFYSEMGFTFAIRDQVIEDADGQMVLPENSVLGE